MTEAITKKRPRGRKRIVGIILFVAFATLVVLNCSGISFHFLNAQSSLNHHLRDDFGFQLPPSAMVTKAYWIAMRDPEEVFEVDVAPAEVIPFVNALRAAAKDRKIEINDMYNSSSDEVESKASRQIIHPAYGAPPWWNHPPITAPLQLQAILKDDKEMAVSDYGFLISPSTGRIYVFWGEF